MRLEEYKNEESKYSLPPDFAQPHPWLVICHGNNMQKQTFFSISEDRYYVYTIPELQNKRICAYADEWLVLLDFESRDCCLWNPTSEDKIQLPPVPKYDDLECLLSAPPYDPECRVVFLIDDTDTDVEIPDDMNVKQPTLYFCKPGYNQEFHRQDLEPIAGDNNLYLWTSFKKKIYGLTCQRSILVLLDLDIDSGMVTVTPIVNQPVYDYSQFLDMLCSRGYLIQSSCDVDDMLLYVRQLYCGRFMREEVYGFLIFRFDFVKKAWVKMKNIGETAIFLCNNWGRTCSTRGTNLNRNSIYFTEHEGRCLYVFNLETQSISVSLPCPNVSKKNSWFYWLNIASSK